MSVSLSKGQKISLSKAAPGLSNLLIALGWDPVKKKGLFGMGGSSGEIDLDASVIVLNASKQVLEYVYFGQLRSRDGAIAHGGDNLTGKGDGDDEVIRVDLDKLSKDAAHLVVTVNSYRGQTFNEVENAYCRLADTKSGKEICRFELSEKGRNTGFVMAVVSRVNGEWEAKSLGVAATGRTAQDLVGPALGLI
jgi:tellurium resistance protein TerZ